MLSRFFLHPVKDGPESEKAGHPVFKDVVYLELIIPGAIDDTTQRRATDADKETYAEAWAKFEAGTSDQITGWRIEQWAALSPAEVQTLKASKFLTVESIAEASDHQVQAFMGGVQMRAKARAALAQAKDSGASERFAAEVTDLKDEIKRLQDENARLAEQISELAVKRGRPRKELADA